MLVTAKSQGIRTKDDVNLNTHNWNTSKRGLFTKMYRYEFKGKKNVLKCLMTKKIQGVFHKKKRNFVIFEIITIIEYLESCSRQTVDVTKFLSVF